MQINPDGTRNFGSGNVPGSRDARPSFALAFPIEERERGRCDRRGLSGEEEQERRSGARRSYQEEGEDVHARGSLAVPSSPCRRRHGLHQEG